MGSHFRLPILAADSAAELAAAVRALGGLTVAAVSRRGLPLARLARGPTPLALVLGGESRGLSAADRAAADQRVSIPMPPGVDSFSINAAAAIQLYEVVSKPVR
jgi:tRNA G18 (ribose-2'-O)-methylase SpoU